MALIHTASVVCLYMASALLSVVVYRLSPLHPLASYPGPRLWHVSNLCLTYVLFKGKHHHVLDELHRVYGPFVRIGPNTLSINTLSANIIYSAHMHMAKSDSYLFPGHNRAVALFFKQDTEKIHSDRKRIWSSAFTSAAVSNFFPVLERRASQILECIEKRQARSKEGTVDLAECLCHWAYDVMGEIVFGGSNDLELMRRGDPEHLVHGGRLAVSYVDSIGQSPWLMDIIWHLPVGRSLTRLRDVAAQFMQRRIETDDNVTIRDLSSYLLAGDSVTGDKIPHEDLKVEAIIAIQGGSDNTSTTLAHIFYFLLSRPEYYTMLRAELDNVFANPMDHLDHGTLASLAFLNAVITEALRLGSSFFVPRIVPTGGFVLEGRHIPEGTIVAIAAYSQQMSPENYWPDPLGFRPERWLPEGLGPGSKTEKTALFSFSSGPHACIGKAFAYQEMRLVLARLVLNYDMELAAGFDVQAYRDGILNMRTTILQKPLMVRAVRRSELRLKIEE
ncbi:cytochrome P450 [Laetiporus sulphureus 93-53]|uniref:Cytochrome P450 n=1 Tax=Laetiporus sulphureus 93-53 TaxID=1314785 RepID=A0A165DX69_9APHY|nr:cytochrome P450 [Laetiporus sulphureus 93-53]KZT05810.1 cytochrome P450 [Laetiporus sulphureus 93-53]